MPRYIAGRVAQAAFSLLGVSLVVFALLHFSGDPAVLLVSADARPEDVATVRRALGLDRPFHVQYLRFLQRAVMGDFGLSLRLNRPAGGVILDHFPATAELAAGAVIVAAAVSLPLGAVAAVRRGSAYDAAASALALVGQSMPVFWLGLIAIMLFGVRLGWFPVGGRGTFVHLVLPSVTLGWYITALLTRLIRSSLLEVLGQDYIRTARAKGLSRIMVLARHALKNAAIPVVTV
ncbi:MAG: ABC transporter permease, partial [Armatimonadetes bacterium]|nr:ABC transporter permease [Armatimonadota bacterium]